MLSKVISGNVYAETSVNNERSISVLEKNNFEFVGYAYVAGNMRKYTLTSESSDYKVYRMK